MRSIRLYERSFFHYNTLPLTWSISEEKFISGNSYCGKGKCFIGGFGCYGRCKSSYKNDPNVECKESSENIRYKYKCEKKN